MDNKSFNKLPFSLCHIAPVFYSSERQKEYSGSVKFDDYEDHTRFEEKTEGSIMIMDFEQFSSIGQVMVNRLSIVIWQGTTEQKDFVSKFEQNRNLMLVYSLEAAIEVCHSLYDIWNDEIFIIGGASLHNQTLAIIDKVYLTVSERIKECYPHELTESFCLSSSDLCPISGYQYLLYEKI